MFYKSTIREFEVQARMISRPYAWNCAFAALENNDLVIIDACNGAINIIPRITSPAGKGPRITWIGNRYTVRLNTFEYKIST